MGAHFLNSRECTEFRECRIVHCQAWLNWPLQALIWTPSARCAQTDPVAPVSELSMLGRREATLVGAEFTTEKLASAR